MGVDLTSEHPESLIRLFLYVRFEGLLAHHVIVRWVEEERCVDLPRWSEWMKAMDVDRC